MNKLLCKYLNEQYTSLLKTAKELIIENGSQTFVEYDEYGDACTNSFSIITYGEEPYTIEALKIVNGTIKLIGVNQNTNKTTIINTWEYDNLPVFMEIIKFIMNSKK